MSSNQTITLIANDGVEVQASIQAVKQSITLRHMLEDLLEIGTDMPVPIPEVNGETLKKCIEWCEHHRKDPYAPTTKEETPAPGSRTKLTEVPEWDKDFFKFDDSELLLALLSAANYLDIPLLLQYAVSATALKILDKSTEEMRKFFNIQTDFSPEEEAKIRKENGWIDQHGNKDSEK
ncbi:s-phase kinase-associated protein 1 [Nemania abortiva]|nr:s-phase kinase-associated protein 1 [Nemania abortiva]